MSKAFLPTILEQKEKKWPSWSWKTCSSHVRPIVFMIFSQVNQTSFQIISEVKKPVQAWVILTLMWILRPVQDLRGKWGSL